MTHCIEDRHMNLINTPLTPQDLKRSRSNIFPQFAILGTCVAERLLSIAQNAGISADHYIVESDPGHPIPTIDWSHYDAGIVHITMRQLLRAVAPSGTGDVAYIDDLRFDDVVSSTVKCLNKRLDEITSFYNNSKPMFYISFLEPPQTSRGIFYNNRENSIYRLMRELNDFMAGHLSGTVGHYYLETNDFVSYFGNHEFSDSYHNHFTHAGFFGQTESGNNVYRSILQRIVDALDVLNGSDQIKIIITDLDNTMWNGVAAEEDDIVPWQHTEGWPIGYVEALLECKRRGILLAICSKNDETKTRENFKKLWGERISIDDFCSVKINWLRKSENISSILQEVNILPGSALFIDDNPVEIDEVKNSFPEIRTLSYPPEQWRNILLHSPQLQVVAVTEESRNKNLIIKEKIARDDSKTLMSHAEWLVSLSLTLRFVEIYDDEHKSFSRALELINKTNQFNTTGRRWGIHEIRDLFDAGGFIIACLAHDRFSNHGLISAAIISGDTILQIVLSCRVFNLGIETAMLNKVIGRILNSGFQNVRGLLNETGKNSSCMNFYYDNGFIKDDDSAWVGKLATECPEWITIEN